MTAVIHFNMIVEINQLLKYKGIEYSIHSSGGCTSCGIELRCDGNKHSIDEVIRIINDYLSDKWMKVVRQKDNSMHLNVFSNFQ